MSDDDHARPLLTPLAPPSPRPSTSTLYVGVTLLQSLRVVLHIGVILALTIRSAHIGNALHPYERGLANEWIHLLFYVDTTKSIPSFDPNQPPEVVPFILPHFLLESEEEIAANVEDEFVSGGFAVRASSYPVGMLFTINETRTHLHGAVRNYLNLADVALSKFVIAGGNDEKEQQLPFPELTVWKSWDGETTPHKYTLTGHNESEWPAPLRLQNVNATETREFFDLLDGMELLFMVGMNHKKEKEDAEQFFKWWVRFSYDLQSQGHLEVSLNFGLKPTQSNRHIDDLPLSLDQKHDIPAIFFDRNTLFDCCLLALILIYQSVEFVLKWWNSQTAVALLSPRNGSRSPRYYRTRAWHIFQREARDFWFWCILAINIATMVCVFSAWYHSYRLFLWDGLCLAFATCCALQWISLVRYLSVNTRFHILGLTLQRGLPRVAQFLVGVLPIFVGYVLFGTIMFGAKVPRFQSVGTTATTLFSIANGDEIHDTFNAVAFTPWIGQIYIYSYLILFSYVVLMVCIGIIEDAFFSAVFPASWPSLHQTELDEASRRKEAKRQEGFAC